LAGHGWFVRIVPWSTQNIETGYQG